MSTRVPFSRNMFEWNLCDAFVNSLFVCAGTCFIVRVTWKQDSFQLHRLRNSMHFLKVRHNVILVFYKRIFNFKTPYRYFKIPVWNPVCFRSICLMNYSVGAAACPGWWHICVPTHREQNIHTTPRDCLGLLAMLWSLMDGTTIISYSLLWWTIDATLFLIISFIIPI